MHRIALILGICGSAIGIICGILALATVGADPAYSARLWAGWAALLFAILPTVTLLLPNARPITVSFVLLIVGIVGFVCINLFYINTWYVLAIPFWLLAAVGELVSNRSRIRSF